MKSDKLLFVSCSKRYMALGACCKVVIWAVFYLGSRAIASEQFVTRGATASYSNNQLHNMVFACGKASISTPQFVCEILRLLSLLMSIAFIRAIAWREVNRVELIRTRA